jgi:ketosteroid isomerase-like protein
MKFKHINIYLIAFLFIGCSTLDKPDSKAAIKEVMAQQVESWNAGDIDAFMQGYWNSDSLRFISSRGTTYGWQKTMDNYKRSYPDKETMGMLTFEIIDIDVLSESSAFVLGRWHLQRENSVGGYYTLLWKKIDGKWLIVLDHTS